MAFSRSRRESASVAVEDHEDILRRRRLAQLADLFARKERLAVKLAEASNSKRQVDDLRTDYERSHALPLAEGDMQALRRRDDLKGESKKFKRKSTWSRAA